MLSRRAAVASNGIVPSSNCNRVPGNHLLSIELVPTQLKEKKSWQDWTRSAAHRERIAHRLVRIDAERAKLAEELGELEVTERVLSRFVANKADGRRRRSRQSQPSQSRAEREPKRRGSAPGRRKARGKPEIPLGDAALRAVSALGNEASAEQVREYLGRQFGMDVRANHLGMALARHRRAGRLQQHDGRWSTSETESAETEAA